MADIALDAWFHAAREGNYQLVKDKLHLYAKRFDPKPPCFTALQYASLYGHFPLVCLLLDVEKGLMTEFSWTALMLAASAGNTDIVAKLAPCEAGVKSSHTFSRFAAGSTALLIAASRGYMECVNILYPYDGKISGWTDVFLDAMNMNVGSLLALCAQSPSALVSAKDIHNRTPLSYLVLSLDMFTAYAAAPLGAHDRLGDSLTSSMLRASTGAGADANVSTSSVGPAEDGRDARETRAELQENLVAALLKIYGDVLDVYGKNVLHLAAQCGNAAATQLVIRHAPYLLRTTVNNSLYKTLVRSTSLMLAAQAKHVDVCTLLEPHERRMRTVVGVTALMLAAKVGCASVVRLLVAEERGLCTVVEQPGIPKGATALFYAVRFNHPDCAEILLAFEEPVVFDIEIVDEAAALRAHARRNALPPSYLKGLGAAERAAVLRKILVSLKMSLEKRNEQAVFTVDVYDPAHPVVQDGARSKLIYDYLPQEQASGLAALKRRWLKRHQDERSTELANIYYADGSGDRLGAVGAVGTLAGSLAGEDIAVVREEVSLSAPASAASATAATTTAATTATATAGREAGKQAETSKDARRASPRAAQRTASPGGGAKNARGARDARDARDAAQPAPVKYSPLLDSGSLSAKGQKKPQSAKRPTELSITSYSTKGSTASPAASKLVEFDAYMRERGQDEGAVPPEGASAREQPVITVHTLATEKRSRAPEGADKQVATSVPPDQPVELARAKTVATDYAPPRQEPEKKRASTAEAKKTRERGTSAEAVATASGGTQTPVATAAGASAGAGASASAGVSTGTGTSIVASTVASTGTGTVTGASTGTGTGAQLRGSVATANRSSQTPGVRTELLARDPRGGRLNPRSLSARAAKERDEELDKLRNTVLALQVTVSTRMQFQQSMRLATGYTPLSSDTHSSLGRLRKAFVELERFILSSAKGDSNEHRYRGLCTTVHKALGDLEGKAGDSSR